MARKTELRSGSTFVNLRWIDEVEQDRRLLHPSTTPARRKIFAASLHDTNIPVCIAVNKEDVSSLKHRHSDIESACWSALLCSKRILELVCATNLRSEAVPG